MGSRLKTSPAETYVFDLGLASEPKNFDLYLDFRNMI